MTSASAPLETALGALREALVGSRLPLDIADSGLGRQSRAELLDQIDDYLLPRLAAIDAPLLVVIGGSTGSGKSTLTNTLVGHAVSAAGVLRPTTRAPVLVCHPDDEAWFRRSDGVLADLAKVTVDGPAADPGRAQGRALQLVVTPEIGAGVAILDSPDIDSVEVANHELASQLLGAADMWLFVTTAARYADAVPWEYLKRARERAAALALVINRIPPGAEDEVAGHMGEMLEDRGLGGTHIFAIAEGAVAQDQLGAGALEVRAWLEGLAGDADARNELVRATLDGAVRSLPERAERVADSLDRQVAQATEMRAMVTRSYGNALDDIMDELVSGQLLRGEVIEQWQVHVGTGKFMRNLQRGVGRMRDRIRSTFTGKPMADVDARGELEQNLSALVRDAADSCAASVADGWDDLPGGSQVLDLADDRPSRASADLPTRLNIEIGHWQDDVLSMVRESAGSKVAVARGLSVGINTVGVALMVAVFSQTGGVTGGEAGVAAGTAAVSQTVLSAVFGEQAMRDLAKKSRSQLRERLETVLAAEAERFTSLLDELPDTGSVEALRDAAAEVEKLGGAKRRKGRR